MKKTTLFLLGILFSLGISAQTPFYFIQLTDPQFGMIDKNASLDKETALMEKAVKQINKLNPGFVVVTGDLVNDGNNADQIKEFKRILATLRKDIPVYLTPGTMMLVSSHLRLSCRLHRHLRIRLFLVPDERYLLYRHQHPNYLGRRKRGRTIPTCVAYQSIGELTKMHPPHIVWSPSCFCALGR
ncbi:MAG: metallophosphoesterase [Parabacteroides chartae]|nr:metallophosphoesterase [Parabacteroides chartae]